MSLIAAKYAKILEHKETDRTSLIAKKAWWNVELDFNATYGNLFRKSAAKIKKIEEILDDRKQGNVGDWRNITNKIQIQLVR